MSMVSSRRNFRTAVGLAAAMVVALTVLSMLATARNGSRSHAAASGRGVVTVTRVVSKFEDCVGDDGAQSLLPSESRGEVVLSIRDGFVLERGKVAEAGTGVVFAVSGGCCLEDATVYSVRGCYMTDRLTALCGGSDLSVPDTGINRVLSVFLVAVVVLRHPINVPNGKRHGSYTATACCRLEYASGIIHMELLSIDDS